VNTTPICADIQELAAELALGDLPGDERARLLAHLGQCPACEALVSELAYVVDSLLLLAPEVDPAVGFESRVMGRIEAIAQEQDQARRWTRTRTLVLGAAAVIAVAAGVVGALLFQSGPAHPYRTAPLALRTGPLVGANHKAWGEAVVSDGQPSWVFVTMAWQVPDGSYTVELDRSGAPSTALADIQLRDGQGGLGLTVTDASSIVDVRVVDHAGHTICVATLKPA
jgi:putative zinc finger protein